MKTKTDWDKKIEKRTANIGFISRSNAFKEPTPAEKAAALAIETKSWEETANSGWKAAWKVSAPYSTSRGAGVNLRIDTIENRKKLAERRERAIQAYLKTPMDKNGVLKSLGIDVKPYENPPTFLEKCKKKIFGKEPATVEEWVVKLLPFFVTALFGLFLLTMFHKGTP